MKKYLLIFTIFLALNSYGQAVKMSSVVTKIDENTVVKDEAGTILSYLAWKKLTQTGEYSLKPNVGTAEFIVYKMNAQEKARADERKRGMLANMPKPGPSSAFKIGEKFRGENVTDIDGNKFDLKTSSEKVYVINFWFIDCPPCKQEIPELNQLVARYKENKDVVFIAIALDDRTSLKKFLKTSPFNYNVVGNGKYYADKFEVFSFPTHVIVGKDGLIKFSTLGLAPNTLYWIEKTLKEQLTEI